MLIESVWYEHQDRQIDQRNGLGSAGQLIFDQGAKTIQERKDSFFLTKDMEQLDTHMQTNELWSIICTVY